MDSTLSLDTIKSLAQNFHDAEQKGQQFSPPTSKYSDMTIGDAYRIQDELVDLKMAGGRTIKGHKIGLTSKPMQKAFGIDEPDFGVLLDDMVLENDSKIKLERRLEPRIEVELGFILGKDISSEDLSDEAILDCVDRIVPAMEIIDFRISPMDHNTGKRRTVKDSIADNAANCYMIIGDGEIPKNTDLKWVSAVLKKNGIVEESGVSAAVLGHPLNSLRWLIKTYASIGRKLEAGQIVLAGSFTSPIPIAEGDVFEADFNQFGKVNCSFE